MSCGNSETIADDKTLHIYLVRHAEKQGGDNPSLTPQGQKRAQDLALIMESKALNSIYSSDYNRTLETALPTAQAYGLGIDLYDPRALDEFAQFLKLAGETTLVVGHSNTTPQLAIALGGEGAEPIDDKVEFDRLYHLILSADGTVTTEITRYP